MNKQIFILTLAIVITALMLISCTGDKQNSDNSQENTQQASNNHADNGVNAENVNTEDVNRVLIDLEENGNSQSNSYMRSSYDIVSESQENIAGRMWKKIVLSGSLQPYEDEESQEELTGTGEIYVYFPDPEERFPRLLLGLPGYSREKQVRLWETERRISMYADQYGFVIALCEMKNTVYETRFYNTPDSYRWCQEFGECSIPGARWVGEVVLPFLQQHYRIRTNVTGVGIFGLSTGGQGAVLIAQLYDDFKAACSMSGTFDLMNLREGSGEYNIHAYVYGDRQTYPERWQRDDSMLLVERLAGKSVMLIHGQADLVVPASQSRNMANLMETMGYSVSLTIDPVYEHTETLWSGYTDECMKFFDEKL